MDDAIHNDSILLTVVLLELSINFMLANVLLELFCMFTEAILHDDTRNNHPCTYLSIIFRLDSEAFIYLDIQILTIILLSSVKIRIKYKT